MTGPLIRVEELIAGNASPVYWVTSDGDMLAEFRSASEAVAFAKDYTGRFALKLESAVILPFPKRGAA